MSKIDKLLAEEGAAAENYEITEPLPEHVEVSRRNRGRAAARRPWPKNTADFSAPPTQPISRYPR
jgi:hypothetical protein